MELAGTVALVTGGGTGIGRAATLALARRGVAVGILYSRSAAEAEETAHAAESLNGRAVTLQGDVADERQVERAIARLVERWGGIDLLVNNAGTTQYIPLTDLDAVTDAIWDRIFAVNVKGILYCSRAAAPHMRARGRGAIVNVTSVAGLTGDGSSLPYAVSKAAAIGLTRSLARALAPTIRVNSVAPGIVETRWTAGRDEHVRRLGESALLGRNATPEDVAETICALLGQDATTGQNVVVDGGRILN